MNCGRFEKLIDSYLDGQLSGTLLAEFHAHRLNCRRCSRTVSMLQAAGDVIAQDRCEPKVCPDFAARVVAALPQTQKPDRSLWLVRLTAGAAGLAAAAAITAAVLLSGPVRPTAIAGVQGVADGSGVEVSKDAQVTHHVTVVQNADQGGTLLDGKVIRDAVETVVGWDEVRLKGQ